MDGNGELLSLLDKPNRRLVSALSPIISGRVEGQTKYHEHLQRLVGLEDFQHPGIESDILFEADYHHVAIEPNLLGRGDPYCSRCDRDGVTSQDKDCRCGKGRLWTEWYAGANHMPSHLSSPALEVLSQLSSHDGFMLISWLLQNLQHQHRSPHLTWQSLVRRAGAQRFHP